MNNGNSTGAQSLSLQNRKVLSGVILSAGFSLTGAGTVMLGVILPALSETWSLRDDQLGLLLFLQFFASGLGAIVTGLNRIRSLRYGYGLLVSTLCWLYFSGSRFAFTAFFFYGLGLGMTMTATSLLFSDRWGDDCAAKLEWLNFSWSAGATAGPICILPYLRHGEFPGIFLLLLLLFLAVFCWVIFIERQDPISSRTHTTRSFNRSARTVFLLLLILAMSFVGVEAALSGWLTTYSHRVGIHDLAGAALATSVFWFGEMLSRLVFSTRLLARVGRRAVLRWGIAGVTVSMIALITIPHPWSIIVVAGAAGLCIGPLYPLSLSYLLELSPWGWFFAAGGMGAAVFPWLTGLVSDHFHSLRYGLAVPCVAGFVLIVLNAVLFRLVQPVATPVSAKAQSA